MTAVIADAPGYAPAESIHRCEQAVAGSAMASAAAAEELGGIVRPEHFFHGDCALIFAAALALAERGDPVDPVAVLAELTRTGDLGRVNGGPGVHDCYAAAVPAAAWHAARVAADFRRRQLLSAAETVTQMASSPSFDPEFAFGHARKLIEDATTAASGSGPRAMGPLIADVIDGLEQQADRGLPSGLRDLDAALAGLAAGELVIVAARPAAGKSVLAAGIAAHAAADLGLPVLFSSLEMSAEEITLRLISARARVPLTSLLRRQLTTRDWEAIAAAATTLSACPLLIDDAPGADLTHIRSRLRGMARTAPARLLVVDYLQLLAAPKAENRQVAVAGLSRGLKLIAREHGIPVVVAAQLNRQPEQRGDKRPVLSDLRESGSQEQDADVVILLHRDDMHDPASPRAGEIDLIVAKQRQGPRCTITAGFQGHYARIVDLAPWGPS